MDMGDAEPLRRCDWVPISTVPTGRSPFVHGTDVVWSGVRRAGAAMAMANARNRHTSSQRMKPAIAMGACSHVPAVFRDSIPWNRAIQSWFNLLCVFGAQIAA